ncbi:MAG: sialidase [Verrucomicrobia bacterium]|nr:sialidase [Verrucomicrobiota bacterium]
MKQGLPITFTWLAFAAALCQAQSPSDSTEWSLISSFFQPPSPLESSFGSYRSPLLFPDGTKADSPALWKKRREQIHAAWTSLMGPWPPLLDNPRLEVISPSNRLGILQSRVRVPFSQGLQGEGWYCLPPGPGPFPAALVVYYEPETSVGLGKEPLRDYGLQLARRGIASLSIGTPGGNAWKPSLDGATCQPLSFQALVAANAWQAMAARPEIDPQRIGVVGHSYGGKWAMFAAALWDRFACVAVSDPGIVFDESRPNVNYWEPWYLGLDPQEPRPARGVPSPDNPRTGAYKNMVARGMDLQEIHALIAPRPFWVSGGSEDPVERWQALNHLRSINHLLGHTNRVALTTRPGHSPTRESHEQMLDFFTWALKADSTIPKKQP